MKSILKTFNVGFISNFALIGILSALTSACGSDADSNDPRRYDTTGPEITLNTRPEVQDDDGNVTEYAIGATVELDINQEYVELGAEARDVWDVNDLVDQDIQTEGVQPVLIEGTVVVSQADTYVISYTATDSSGNSNTKTRSIEVADRSGPEITITGPNPITLDFGTVGWVPPAATYIDSYDAADENDIQTVTEISNPVDTSEISSYSVIYTASDLAGNKSEATLTVIVEPDYKDQIVVFQNGAISDAWKPGLNGYDQDLSWGACPAGNCPNLTFGLKNDPIKGSDVIYIDHADNDKQAGFFIQASTPSDLGGANLNGKLSFEVWSENGVDLVTGVDCPSHPQVSNPYHLGIVGKGEWQEISIPAKDLFTDVCASRMDKIGTIPMFLNGYKGEEFRIDNIVWYCETSCGSESLDDVVYDPWVKVEKTNGNGDVAPISYDGYDLVWNDEFDGTEIDLTKWQLIDAGGGFGNSELQYYRPDNAYVENGLLVVETQIQKSTDAPLSPADESFSSAKLTTQDRFEFKHGRVDIRVAAAEGQGFWSAAWMLGANVDTIGWPFSGEVDIFESVGGVLYNVPQEGRMVHNAYWNADGPFAPGQASNNYQRSSYSPTPGGGQLAWGERVINETNEGETFSNTFHVISIEWDEEKIRYFIDGVNVDGKDLNLNAGETCAYGQQPNEPQLTCLGQSFNHDFFLILNVAVGGTWPKAPDATTQWPRGMLVDYVRVYQTAAQQAAQQ